MNIIRKIVTLVITSMIVLSGTIIAHADTAAKWATGCNENKKQGNTWECGGDFLEFGKDIQIELKNNSDYEVAYYISEHYKIALTNYTACLDTSDKQYHVFNCGNSETLIHVPAHQKKVLLIHDEDKHKVALTNHDVKNLNVYLKATAEGTHDYPTSILYETGIFMDPMNVDMDLRR